MEEFNEGALTGAQEMDEENLFADLDEEVTAESEEGAQGENPQEDGPYGAKEGPADQLEAPADQPGGPNAEGGGAQQESETVTLKVYGQEVKVPKTQLNELAQKGLAYDRLRQERDALAGGREMQLLQRYAAASGMEMGQSLDYLERSLDAAALKRETDAGMSEKQARELLELRQKEAQRRAAESAAAAQRQRTEPYLELVRAYPNLTSLPPEVVQRISAGERPLEAYRAYELAQAKAEIETLKAAQKAKAAEEKNRKTVAGSAAGIGNGKEQDEFLAGFLGAFDD